jgi:hypothetical protein
VRVSNTEAGPVVRVIVIGVLLALLAIAVALTISAAHENSRADTVRHRGVPVHVTVTGCQGVSSGIGMGIEYFECRGTYRLDGRSYNEVIGGNRVQLQTGQMVPAMAVPGQPRLLSVATPGPHSDWKPYIAPIILGALVGAGVISLLWWSKRRHPGNTSGAGAAD